MGRNVELHNYAFTIAAFCALWSTVVSCYLVYKHARHYTQPHLQRSIIKILWIVPIYAINSWLSLIMKEYSLYFDLLRDCYEAYVLYHFFTLLTNYLGGEENLIRILRRKPVKKYLSPFCCFTFKPGMSFFNWSRFYVLQFTLCNPLLTALSIVFSVNGTYGEGEFLNFNKAYVYIEIIINISISLSLYFLVLFYEVLKEELAPVKPVPKFLSIKSVIFFSFWQGLAISLLNFMGVIHDVGSWSKDEIAEGLQDFIICIEMCFVAVWHHYVFDYETYRNPDNKSFWETVAAGKLSATAKPFSRALIDNLNPMHDIRETKMALKSTGGELLSPLLATPIVQKGLKKAHIKVKAPQYKDFPELPRNSLSEDSFTVLANNLRSTGFGRNQSMDYDSQNSSPVTEIMELMEAGELNPNLNVSEQTSQVEDESSEQSGSQVNNGETSEDPEQSV